MTPDEALLAERIRDVERWAADHPDTEEAAHVLASPPVSPGQVDALEGEIRKADPRGLPARCDSCHRRMSMIQRSESKHPKCPDPAP